MHPPVTAGNGASPATAAGGRTRRPGPLGLILPTLPQGESTAVSARALAAVARGAEAAGAGALWACDHVFWHGPVIECMTALAVAATATERAMVGAGVLQLPLRDPVLAAKQAASLEHLSEGRLLLGLGVGSHPGEYAAAGADFHRRGHQLDTDVAIVRSLWRQGAEPPVTDPTPAPAAAAAPVASSEPTMATASTTGGCTPGPYLQLPLGVDAPIWFGGSSEAAMARCASTGDGWMPLFVAPERYAPMWAELQRRCDQAGRDPMTVTPAMVAFVSLAGHGADDAVDRGTRWMSSLYRVPAKAFTRHLVAGTTGHCARQLLRWFEAGAAHVTVFVTDDDPLVQFQDLAAELHDLLGTAGADGATVPIRPHRSPQPVATPVST